jgi:hypothetical protein
MWLVLGSGCASLPCVEDGKTQLIVPESRLGSITDVRVDGVCEVQPAASACDGSVRCTALESGERVMVLEVSSTKLGDCTVSVDFDGCQTETRSYSFRGSLNNCCEDVCAKKQQLVPLSSTCLQ